MTIPGVGPVVSLAFVATIDTPARFRKSKAVGPVLGLTSVRSQSGNTDRVGRISLCGDGMMRTLLFEAAQTMLRQTTRWSWLKALLFQKDSALAQWYRARTADARGGTRKTLIVALARQALDRLMALCGDGRGAGGRRPAPGIVSD